MAVTNVWYGQAIMQAYGSGAAGGAPNQDYLSDALTVTLHTNGYTPNQDTHVFVSDLTSEVAAGGGYATGGIVLASKTLTYTGGTNTIAFDAADSVWPTSTITARYAVLSDRTPGTAATQPLLWLVDFGVDTASMGGDFKITWHANGIATVVVA